jgi:peptidoglycan/xylan/chitin deacetylase (PgdA/CDA1 family)
MRGAVFTVDVDRDVNEPRAGKVEAGCRGSPMPRYDSTLEGLEAIVDVLNGLDIKGTFFLEGQAAEVLAQRTDLPALLRGHEVASHGYAHEDLTGESTGVVPSEEWLDAIVGRSLAALEDVFGGRPKGFRAPYQHINELVARVLRRRDLKYDSSLFAEIGSLRPYPLINGLLEAPLAQGWDAAGRRIQSYLWAMHEGRRLPQEYLTLMSQHDDGIMILADHSWHLAESLGGQRGVERPSRESAKVREVLQSAVDEGLEFMTLNKYLELENR